MAGFWILISIVLAASAALIFGGLFNRSRWADLATKAQRHKEIIYKNLRVFVSLRLRSRRALWLTQDRKSTIDVADLNCRVQTSERRENEETFDAFSVELCGSIQAPRDRCRGSITVSPTALTDEPFLH